MTPTFFGATIADMDLTKLGLSFQGVMESLKQVDPAIWGATAGGAIGGLGTAAATEEEDPNRAAKILLGLSVGAAGGGVAGRHFGPSLGLGKQPSDSGVTRRAETPPPAAGKVQGSPVGASSDLPVGVRARTISGPQAEQRLQQTEQTMRQQSTQQMDQAMQQASVARERAGLLKDQGKVQARMQAFMAPGGGPPSRGPRNITLGPGVRRVFPQKSIPVSGGMKTAGVIGDLAAGMKENPWVPGAIAGGGLGAGLGWATSDKKTRQRKMLMGMLLGAPAGALSAETVNSIIKAMGGVQSAAQEAEGTFHQAGIGLREGAARGMENLITNEGPGAAAQVADFVRSKTGADFSAIERDFAKLAAFEDFISQNPWVPGAVAGAAIGAGVGGMAKKKRGAKALLGAGIGGVAGGVAGQGIGDYLKSRKQAPAAPPAAPAGPREGAMARAIRVTRQTAQTGQVIREGVEAAAQNPTAENIGAAAHTIAENAGLPPEAAGQIAQAMAPAVQEAAADPSRENIEAVSRTIGALFGLPPEGVL